MAEGICWLCHFREGIRVEDCVDATGSQDSNGVASWMKLNGGSLEDQNDGEGRTSSSPPQQGSCFASRV